MDTQLFFTEDELNLMDLMEIKGGLAASDVIQNQCPNKIFTRLYGGLPT